MRGISTTTREGTDLRRRPNIVRLREGRRAAAPLKILGPRPRSCGGARRAGDGAAAPVRLRKRRPMGGGRSDRRAGEGEAAPVRLRRRMPGSQAAAENEELYENEKGNLRTKIGQFFSRCDINQLQLPILLINNIIIKKGLIYLTANYQNVLKRKKQGSIITIGSIIYYPLFPVV